MFLTQKGSKKTYYIEVDGKMVSARVGSSLLVARKDKSLANDIEVLTAELGENDCKLMGAVLNDF